MREKYYEILFANYPVHFVLTNPDTYKWFGWHIRPVNGPVTDAIMLSEELRKERLHFFKPGTTDDFIEYRLLADQTARFLTRNNRFLFHAVAVMWRERVWLLTAPSGTGKTTQYLYWKKLWPDQICLICGDMPVLYRREDGRIWVYPSPWNGSERYGHENHRAAPLGGIVYLTQDQKNQICLADLHHFALPLWKKLAAVADTEEQILSWGAFLDDMLRDYPTWQLANCGDKDSAVLTRSALEAFLEREIP